MDKRNYLIHLILAKRGDIKREEIVFTHDARIRKAINRMFEKENVPPVSKQDPMAWWGDLVFIFHQGSLNVFELGTDEFGLEYREANCKGVVQ